jgi:hypothetical protein
MRQQAAIVPAISAPAKKLNVQRGARVRGPASVELENRISSAPPKPRERLPRRRSRQPQGDRAAGASEG